MLRAPYCIAIAVSLAFLGCNVGVVNVPVDEAPEDVSSPADPAGPPGATPRGAAAAQADARSMFENDVLPLLSNEFRTAGTDGSDFHSSEDAVAAQRPHFVVTYRGG